VRKRHIPDEDEIKQTLVKLPEIFGRKPEQYIIHLYATGIALILFAVLVLPGLLVPGSHVRIDSTVPGAGVFSDDTRLGSTPYLGFLPAGHHHLVIRAPGLVSVEKDVDLPRHILGSLFVLGRTTIRFEQTMPDEDAYFSSVIKDFSRWSMVDRTFFGSDRNKLNYPVPVVLAPAASAWKATHQQETVNANKLKTFLIAAAPHINNAAQAEDFSRAWLVLASTGVAGSSDADVADLLDGLGLRNDSTLAATFGNILPNLGTVKASEKKVAPAVATPVGNASFGGLAFIGFGTKPEVSYLAVKEIGEHLFGEFLDAHPEWNIEAYQKLKDAELVDEGYLSTFIHDKAVGQLPYDKPVRDVSYYAAKAFCLWFTETKLPQDFRKKGYIADLPKYQLWLSADASASSNARGPWLIPGQPLNAEYRAGPGLSNIRGGLFEWSSDTAIMHETSRADVVLAVKRFPGWQRRVLGGAFTMEAKNFDPAAMYGEPATWCSPYTGFRIAIVKE